MSAIGHSIRFRVAGAGASTGSKAGIREIRRPGPACAVLPTLLLGLSLILAPSTRAQPVPPPILPGGLFPPPAGALQPAPDDNALETLRGEALAAGLSEAQARILADRISRMAAGRLPWQPVLDRTRQGLAKGASFERIESVCTALEARVRAGAALVDDAFAGVEKPRPGATVADFDKPRPGTEEARLRLIDHTTFALEHGVEPVAISTIFTTLGPEAAPAATPGTTASPAEASAGVMAAMTSPVVALTTLSSEGVPAGRGVEVVTAAWRNGVRGGQMEELGVGMALALRGGRQREDVMNRVLDMCRRGVPPDKILGDFPRPGPGFQPPKGSMGRPWLPPGRPDHRRGERPPDDPGKRGHPGGKRGGTGGGTGGGNNISPP